METDDESPIRLHFTVGKYRPGVTEADLEAPGARTLERPLEGWDDHLRVPHLQARRGLRRRRCHGQHRAITSTTTPWPRRRLRARYGAADLVSMARPPEVALLDIGNIEKLDDAEGLRVALVPVGEAGAPHLAPHRVAQGAPPE